MDPKPLTIDVVLGFLGGLGGYPQGGLGPQPGRIQGPGGGLGGIPRGSGAPGWQNPGTRGLLGLSEGATPPIFPKSCQNTHFRQFWGSGGYPQGFWGPRLADSRDPGPPGPVRGGDPANFPEKLPIFPKSGETHIFGSTPRGSGAPGWQIPATGVSWACPRRRPRQWPSGRVRAGNPANLPALPCLLVLKREKSFFACFRATLTLTGCERRSVCWEPLFLVERPAQAARTHNPTVIHFSSVLL